VHRRPGLERDSPGSAYHEAGQWADHEGGHRASRQPG
jgi:hypothetical protein